MPIDPKKPIPLSSPYPPPEPPLPIKRLENSGASAIMPLAAPIGSGLGIQNKTNLKILRHQTKVPLIIDAGLGQASDAVIAAGKWAVDTYVNDVNNDGIRLVSNGNNDDGVSDWKAIPEFGTLLMPIASVLLIVGYNYRRKETED